MNKRGFLKYLGIGSLVPLMRDKDNGWRVPEDPLKVGDFVKCKECDEDDCDEPEGYGVISEVSHEQGITYAVNPVVGHPKPHKHAWYSIDEFESVYISASIPM